MISITPEDLEENNIQILIPTFNRINDLIKNLKLLNDLIYKENLSNTYEIIISENKATNESQKEIYFTIKNLSTRITVYKHDTNIGPEKNCLFLLSKATAKYIMFVGDDDFLPENYLTYIKNTIRQDENTSSIIPGFSAFYASGKIQPVRFANFAEKKYSPGLLTVCATSSFGHQLSGLVFKRESIFDEYMKNENYRNMYPFIFFLAYNSLKGNTYYAPKYQVLVSQSNSKDWSYDASGLLIDILKNYTILFPKSSFKRWLCGITFIAKQSWRLRVGKDLNLAWKAFSHLEKSEHIDPLMKLILPFIYGYFYTRLVLIPLKHGLIKLVKN